MSKALIVDDDKSIREMLSEILEGAGFEVGTCRDGKAALEELERAFTEDLVPRSDAPAASIRGHRRKVHQNFPGMLG